MASVSNLLSNLKKQDVYAVLCAYLFEFKEIPEYSIICELAYLLDCSSFVNIINYFGGQVLHIPTQEEFRSALRVLLLLQYTEVEKRPWKESLKLAGFQSSEGRMAQNRLNKLKETLAKYNYGNRNYG
jgi:hypothetical protein